MLATFSLRTSIAILSMLIMVRLTACIKSDKYTVENTPTFAFALALITYIKMIALSIHCCFNALRVLAIGHLPLTHVHDILYNRVFNPPI